MLKLLKLRSHSHSTEFKMIKFPRSMLVDIQKTCGGRVIRVAGRHIPELCYTSGTRPLRP